MSASGIYAYVGNDPLNLTDPSGLIAGDAGKIFSLLNPIGTAEAQVLPFPMVAPPPVGTTGQSFDDASLPLAKQLTRAINNAVHGNSYNNTSGTQVYYLTNRDDPTVIDKIGITSNPNGRYSPVQLIEMNVDYVTVTNYTSRYAAALHENIVLVNYFIQNGELPKYNKVFR